MVRRTNYLTLVAGGLAAFMIGCSPPVNPGTDAATAETTPGTDAATTETSPGTDAGADSTPEVDAGPGQEYTYIVDQLNIDMDDFSIPHTGFNLDDLFNTDAESNGCYHQDWFSTLDTDQNCGTVGGDQRCTGTGGCSMGVGTCAGGVDNQLPALASAIETAAQMDVRALIAEQINTHGLSLIARLSDVNDLTNDSSVTLRLYLAYPTFTTDCTTVTAGRTYVIARSSLTDGATSIDQAKFQFSGRIVGGRLQVGGEMNSRFELPLPAIQGMSISLPLNAVELRANVTATEGTAGNLGGWVSGNDVVDAVAALAPEYEAVVRAAVGGMVDIEVEGICEDSNVDPPRYGGIAVGLGVHMVSATIQATDPIVDDRPAGVCGSE